VLPIHGHFNPNGRMKADAAQQVPESRSGTQRVNPGIGLQEKKPGCVLLLFQPCECLISLAQGRADDGQFVRRNVSLLGLSNSSRRLFPPRRTSRKGCFRNVWS